MKHTTHHSTNDFNKPPAKKGRGAISNIQGRFATQTTEHLYDHNTEPLPEHRPFVPTDYIAEQAKSIITYNRSPDIPFDRSINPYRGCEHGCVYCFARPTHSYLELSPGLDFESKIFYKPNAVDLLYKELKKSSYQCAPIALGINTDAYQPLEKQLNLTRSLLETLLDFRHPVSIITKSTLILRDLDILTELAQHNLVSVMISVTTLDDDLKRIMEPRTANASARLKAVTTLSENNIPVGILAAPMIPKVNDNELEAILQACQSAGASHAGYILLRLPFELRTIFSEWLTTHFPDRASAVMNILSSCHGGKAYRSGFGKRMTGSGVYAEVLSQRFAIACNKLKLAGRTTSLNCNIFNNAPSQTLAKDTSVNNNMSSCNINSHNINNSAINYAGKTNSRIQAYNIDTAQQHQMSLFSSI